MPIDEEAFSSMTKRAGVKPELETVARRFVVEYEAAKTATKDQSSNYTPERISDGYTPQRIVEEEQPVERCYCGATHHSLCTFNKAHPLCTLGKQSVERAAAQPDEKSLLEEIESLIMEGLELREPETSHPWPWIDGTRKAAELVLASLRKRESRTPPAGMP